MNKEEFCTYISENFEVSKEHASAVIEVFAESIWLAMSEGHSIDIDQLGTFTTASIPGRHITHHKANKPITIKEHKRPYFKASADLKLACKY